MIKSSALLGPLPGLLLSLMIAPQALAARRLDVNFTISGTEGFNGVDAATLTLAKGQVSGSVTVITPDGSFACSVNAGSTDIRNRLKLTCTIGPGEMVTLSGTLNGVTGAGKGKFAETFFKETGEFAAMRP